MNTNLERIIAKIENDFNPDNSDWIPRVAAWTIDAMAQLKVFNTIKKQRTLSVNERIAISPCPISEQGFAVYDSNGCKINKLDSKNNRCCSSFTGENQKAISDTVSININNSAKYAPNELAEYTNSPKFEDRHIIKDISSNLVNINKNYIIIGDNKIELSFDTDKIIIENIELETYYSDYFKCNLPVIPDNGNLIEAIASYCMYKMLLRGYKHPVLTLQGNNPAINPYVNWISLKPKVKTSIVLDKQLDISNTNAWRSYFYNFTFIPKN